MKTMQGFMEHTIQDLYSAKMQALEAMPQLMERAQNDQLRQAFQTHQRETEQQIKRLEQIAQQLSIDPDDETCIPWRATATQLFTGQLVSDPSNP